MAFHLSRRARAALASGVCLALLAAGCSGSDDGGAAPATTGPDSPTTAADAADDDEGPPPSEPGQASPPEQFSGPVDDFYVVPDPLPPGEPGQLIRTMPVGEADGATTLRIMYHSRDAQDRDRAVTGLVTYPTGDAPAEGWPVLSWAHGTTGMAAPCAPSRFTDTAPGFGLEGVHVATDYIGLGPVGPDGEGEIHPYLSRPSEGHSVIDAVRAARALPDAHAGDRWFSVGASQGGHGAQAAHELSEAYAPELDLLGTVSFAPAALFDRTYGGADEVVAGIVGIMGLYGIATEQPELDLSDYVTPETDAAAAAIADGCLPEIVTAFLDVGIPELYAQDPFTTEPAASIMAENDVGLNPVDAPLFLVSGTADDRVVIERVEDLFDRLCTIGQVTELLVVEGATHDDIISRTGAETTAWLEARLAGDEPTDSCADR